MGAAANSGKLSVIIPALNEAGCIVDTLQALQSMRQRGHEVILVDGGSTDATRKLGEPLVDRLLESPPGRATQMRAGITVAQGDVFWFLHADTRVSPESDQLILEGLRQTGKAWGRFDVRFPESRGLLCSVPFFMNQRSRLTGIATGDQGIFVSRQAYRESGGIQPISLMEDIALSRSLKRLGRPLALRNSIETSARRWQEYGVLRTILKMWGLRLAYFLGVSPQRLSRFYS